MTKQLPSAEDVLDSIRRVSAALGRAPSRSEFKKQSGMTEYQILKHFPSWREAVRRAGLDAEPTNVRLENGVLLEDWGELVRRLRRIPTRDQYRREGKYSPGVFERHFGPWSAIPVRFRQFAQDRPEWGDVLPLLPAEVGRRTKVGVALAAPTESLDSGSTATAARPRHSALRDRATYGDPMDFRGLRYQPVNEEGVVFLFGMVALELGYLVEAVQAGFPDCEAKRQVGPGKWQRVRIEFEFESRNFRDHGHPAERCDIIVCWRHNWEECPADLEVLPLQDVIESLAKSEE